MERVEVKDVRLPIMMQRLWLPKLRLTERPGPRLFILKVRKKEKLLSRKDRTQSVMVDVLFSRGISRP